MDSPSAFVKWYAIATFGLIISSLSILLLRYAVICTISAFSCFFVRHFLYRLIRLGSFTHVRLTLTDILATVIVALANIACASWSVRSAQQLSLRCASLLATNLVLLLPGMDLTMQCLRMTKFTYQKCHTIVATIAILEGTVHTAIELSKPRWLELKVLVSGIIVMSALGLMLVTSMSFFRRRFFEVLQTAHTLGSVAICASLWLHTRPLPNMSRAQAIAGSCIWTSNLLFRASNILYRNFAWGKACTHVMVERVRNALSIEVSLPRTWDVQPGQYVYLTMGKPGVRSIFQRHPFLVFKSLRHENCIELKVYPRNGFTERLFRRVGQERRLYEPAIIEGPYGTERELDNFGTVLLIATNEGILGHIATINQLLARHRHSRTKMRDIVLVWATDTDDHYDLIKPTFDSILLEDSDQNSDLLQADPRTKWQRPGKRPAATSESLSAPLTSLQTNSNSSPRLSTLISIERT